MQEWNHFLEQMEQKLGKPIVSRWLRSLTLTAFDACNIYLETKDPLQLHWFEEHVRPHCATLLRNRNAREIHVHISIVGQPLQKRSKEHREHPSRFPPDPLLTHSCFDTFSAEELPWLPSFLEDILSKKQPFNPLFFYGESGSGKSHLLMALTQAYQKQGLRCHYIRADTFTQQVVNAIRTFQLRDLRKAYRENDVLLFDDIHLLARKDVTQEEFFHTFNTLYLHGKQIVLSSAVPPSSMQEIEPRLISRFEWGLTHTLYPLPKTHWNSSLSRRCEWLHFPLSDEVRAYLVRTFSTLVSLFQGLDALILRVHLEAPLVLKRNPKLLKKEDVKKFLEEFMQKEQKKPLTAEQILRAVACAFGVRQEDLTGRSQNQECAQSRHIAMYFLRLELHCSYSQIGRLFSRDHSTVITSVRQIEQRINQKDPKILASFAEIKNHLYKLQLKC